VAKQRTGQPLRSAERLLDVLESFSAEHPARTTAEISEELNLAPSTVRRLLLALERHGFVRYDDQTSRFSPHYQILRLAAVTMASNDLGKAVTGPADRLAASTGETVQVTVLDGLEVVHIDGRESAHMWKIFHPVGHRHCAYLGSASGKVLLAGLSDGEVSALLPDARSWPVTAGKARRAFMAELKQVREQGYALNDGETERDVWSVAAPVRDFTGNVVAAINLPCPLSRVADEARKQELIEATMRAAAQTSEALRFRVPDVPSASTAARAAIGDS
jgi:DNA-binding IclR family transcriptional regulator